MTDTLSRSIDVATHALDDYRHSCRSFYRTGRVSDALLMGWDALREAYQGLPADEKAHYNGFSDFLACNDAVPLREILAER